MGDCPFQHKSCQKARCELWFENEGCSIKVAVSVLKSNGKAIYESSKARQSSSVTHVVTSRAVQDQEVERFAESLNVLEVANMPTKDVYTKTFREWCALRGLEPCSSAKLTRKVCDVFGLQVDQGFYRPIRTGAD